MNLIMALIYETENFILESHEKPEIDRQEWGHIKIIPKRYIVDRTELTPHEAIELIRFTIIAGKAFVEWMKISWVNIGRINYQDNGNWNPRFHIHLYGRAVDAKIQKFGDPIISGHRDSFLPLNESDIIAIRYICETLDASEEFSPERWHL
jgi:diadenosine tetraphosphate (Ap4A) HIT family hydrolase